MKELYHIRTKSQLYRLYASQMPEREIRAEINEIIRENRPKNTFPDRPHFARALRTIEVITFIDTNGTPDGYKLSEELQYKLNEYRKEVAEEKRKTFKNLKP
ncbi:hypothetical protein [Flavobacterium cerinum]|uniref:Uncharacterized protein n=1 Tax=Flavobacterium cerinum TaxID=2502784 RepID=A0ABY5IRZ1_9FLAO|nr:hypothetical protein [Flavobacterium cerinum]UUC45565.1 hypothetical protein NOX80_18335 [Flavobacterium cerinum]